MTMRKLYKKLSLTALLALFIASISFAQDRTISGTVTDEEGGGMPGVNVLVKGTSTGTATDATGKFSISAGDQAVLVFSFVGYATSEEAVGARSVINVSMKLDVTSLNELVVTGYTSERKADIIGSVAVVTSKELLQTPSANLSQMLQGRAAGVMTSGTGAPGEGAKVRIRGFSSFSGSDPLYVIDGVPTTDAGRVNPNDIESIQVLKDATAASIYGSRAAGGVIIVTTKQGKAGTMNINYNAYAGVQYIPSSYQPDLLNTRDYATYLKTLDPAANHPLFGIQGNINPDNLPAFYVTSPGLKAAFPAGAPQVNPSLYTIADYGNTYQITPVSAGTNWFDEVTRNAGIQNHQLQASGGTDKSNYSVSMNYFDQNGVYEYSGYKRASIRVNTAFKPNKYIRIGENLQFSHETFRNATGGGARGEASAWAQSFRMVPYIPVFDIAGGFGGNGIGSSGNGTNPIAQLYRDRNDKNLNYKMFGNVFLEVNPIKDLTFRTSFGLDYSSNFSKDYVIRTYERAENTTQNALNQSNSYGLAWTWSNTATYSKTFGDHQIKVLAGTEAVKTGMGDGISTQNVNTFDFEDPLFMSLNTNLGVGEGSNSTFRQNRTLYSVFGRVDYSFQDKYLFNATVRRDGSSVYGKQNTYGTFPAFGVGYRISQEAFMQSVTFISDLKIRGGWGQMGNQSPVDPLNQYTTFRTNPGLSNYDINRTNNSLVTGYSAFNASSQATKWETSESTNIGFDAALFAGKIDLSFSYFNIDTKDLLVDQQAPPQGGFLSQPKINLGKMRNRGFEFNIGNKGTITGDLSYDVSMTFTHFKNTAIDLDGNPLSFYSRNASRLNNVWRTQAGQPISSFYGLERDGFYNTLAETVGQSVGGAVPTVGSWKFKDRNGDGKIDDDDRTFIGSPQPKFIMGFNLGLRYKGFDVSTFLLWNYGNDLYNYTKYFTDMRVFVGGVSRRVINEGWTPERQNALLPQLGAGANDGYTPFIRSASNDYYIESGSYLRGKTIQIGYTVPAKAASAVGLTNARIYVQGQNYFTITKYSGPDPDISISGSNNELSMGLDDAAFPNPRQILIGLNLSF